MRTRLWTASLALILAVLLAGCSAGDQPSQPDDAGLPETVTPSAAGAGTAGPSAIHLDSEGRRPGDALLELIAARNAADWESVYSLYAHPEGDFEIVAREWAEAADSYRDFVVHETRAIDDESALVRVTYSVEVTPPGAPRREFVVAEPGEWWAVEMVDGLWKVQWLARQW
ncbi:MAG TPA: hypothetical protein VLQ52_06035 [Coriobacteriia bacterium]|nr:hypothetical protein [Coriobacteriia bacterium]